MEFEDPAENEVVEMEMEMDPSYNSLANSNTAQFTKTPSLEEMLAEPTSQRKPKYKECLKNHAVGIAGQAVDGCGEFLAAGAEGTLDALKCAACNCHRNFHRRESLPAHDPFHFHHHRCSQQQLPPPPQLLSYRTPSGYLHVSPQPQHRRLALPSTSGGGKHKDMSNMHTGGGGGGGFAGSSEKRVRTKFRQEQKEKMLELAEKLGWRIQKQDEEILQQFCNEFGIKRHVLKVWMHNNKHTLGKKP